MLNSLTSECHKINITKILTRLNAQYQNPAETAIIIFL